MPHLHLPADHDEHDRELATALARALRSSDLYVTYTAGNGRPSRPVVPTNCATEPRPRRRGLARLLDAFAPRRAA